MNTRPQTTGLILAGGAGRRVKGQDKGLLEWRGRPLIEHVLDRFKPQVAGLIISCNRNIQRYRQYSELTVEDELSDYQGPLAGLQAASSLLNTSLLAVTPCDTPLLPSDLVEKLWQSMMRHDADICYARDHEREHFLCALIRREALSDLKHFMDAEGRAVKAWYASKKTVAHTFDDGTDGFTNFNKLGA